MSTARIITSAPERAAEVARFLRTNGFSVEVVMPEESDDDVFDLEIDLAKLPEFAITDPEAYFLPERQHVVEREFVFAPAWRALRTKAAELYAVIARPRDNDVVDAQPRSEHRREPRLRRAIARLAQRARAFGVVLANVPATLRPRPGLGSAISWVADRWLLPSFSIAAGMVVAFLLGLWAASGPEPNSSPAAARVTPAVQVETPPVASSSSLRKEVKAKPTPVVRQHSTAAGLEDDQEVVVRRYPSRGTVAQSPERKKVKQFSDLDNDRAARP